MLSSTLWLRTSTPIHVSSIPRSGGRQIAWCGWSWLYRLGVLLLCIGGQQAAFTQEQEIRSFDRQALTDTYYSEGVAVGDINGDSHNDVVYGPYWFAGPEFSEKHEIYAAKPQPMERYADNFFSWVLDFDQDGHRDVLVVGFPGTPAYVYQNPGKGIGEWKKHEVLDWVSNESPQFVNLVGDARPELVCTRDGFFGFATVDWSRPFQTWKFHAISEKVTAPKFGHGLGIGDVNGDGRPDILHAGGWYEQPQENALNSRWREHAVKFSTAGGGAEMYAYDVDGDGDQDIITSESAHNFGLSWYEQTGDGEFKQHVILGAEPSENKYGVLFSELHSVALADMDGDGLKDIVTGKTYWSHHRQSPMWDAGAVVYWFKLVRGEQGVDWIPFQAHGETGIGRQLTVADINADGLPDLAVGGMLGANVLIQNKQAVSKEQFDAAQPKPYAGTSVPDSQDLRGLVLRGPRSPIDGSGKVPGAIEGESLTAQVTRGAANPQPMKNFTEDHWSGDSQLWWRGAKPGDLLSIEIDVFDDIDEIQLALTCARDYAIVEVKLDGKSLAEPIDLYHPTVVSTGLLTLPTPGLKRGKHRLSFEIKGANPKAAKAYMVGLDFVRFKARGQDFPEPDRGLKPTAADGRVLNLDFETGTLADWTAVGEAFQGQPIQGDTVSQRRGDMRSGAHGQSWIGGFEKLQDKPTGTLTSQPFRVTERFASFYVAGGSSPATRVELYAVGEDEPFFSVSGRDSEELSRVVVDLRRVENREMFVRLVDDSSEGWGHINFDHFRLHAQRPGPLTPPLENLTVDEYPHAGLAGEAAAAAMRVPDGFQVNLCAAEPDVKQPIAMALDDRGRTWIAEAYEYPQRAAGDNGRDRILIFEDTTGDGKFDSRKVFAEGLNLVSGLEVGFGGVWVGAAPYLLFIPDANGDDVPDGEPQRLLDGWGYQDTHETLNAFCWGPDGWLYGCHGVFTHSKVGKPGTPDDQRTPINAGVWRYHPSRHEFEVFAHGTSNPWGVDFDQYGEAFITACVIPHLYHMIPGGRYQRQGGQHFNPYTYDDIKTIADHLHYLGSTPHSGNGKSDEAGGGHAHAGAMIYQGGAWPSEYDGVLFMNNIHGQRLNTDILEPEGSGYVAHHGPDFLLTGDQASQILNMRYGPDGQVTFIDWYDMQACHRREAEVHDRSNGRIYKVSYGKTAPLKIDLTQSSDLELAEMCLHKNDWYVRHARRLLQERATQRKIEMLAIDRLQQIATSHEDDTRRLRAIWARHAIGVFDRQFLGQLFRDSSPHVRGWALRLLMEQQKNQLNEQQIQRLVQLAAEDSSPVVRRSIISEANRLPLAARWSLVSALANHAEDANDHNLPLLLWYVMEPLADEDPDRALALGMAAGEQIPLLRQFMLRRVGGAGGAQAIERLLNALQKADSAEIQITFLAAMRAALSGQRTAERPAKWDALFQSLSQHESLQVRLQAAALGVTFDDQRARQMLRKLVDDQGLAAASRVEALQALLDAKVEMLDRLLELATSTEQPAELQAAAIRGLSQYEHAAIAPAIVQAYPTFSDDLQRVAIATLCSRAKTAKVLLTAIEAKQIPAADLTADLARQLEYLGDDSVTQLLGRAWGQVRESSADKAQLMDAYRQLVARTDLPKADIELGKAMFAKTCQRCHVLYGVGEKLGPDLTGSNRANLDYLLENIVDPSAVMANEYRQSIFLTEDGQVVTGIVRGETQHAVTVQTADASIVLPKEEIVQRKASELSMMPDNQLSQFSEHEIRSLLAYLRAK